MSNFYTRQHYKSIYGPLAQKTLDNILKRELLDQFGFENMGLIADALIKRFLEILREYSPDKIRLLPGQVLWLAVDVREKCGYGKSMLKTRLVPVVLTLIAPEDLEEMINERKDFSQLRPEDSSTYPERSQGAKRSLSPLGCWASVRSISPGNT